MIVTYVSGHGFGHATRMSAVLRELRALRPGIPIEVVTSAPELLFRDEVPGGVRYRQVECDVGVAQRGPLAIHEGETERRALEFEAGFAELAAREAACLDGLGARLVVGDVPPLAFAAARRSGVPSVAVANFSWDWIYGHLASRAPGLQKAAESAAAAYREADVLLRLPFTCEMPAFRRAEDVPMVARHPRVGRLVARERLELGGGPVVLLLFGGFGLPGFDVRSLADVHEYEFVTTHTEGELAADVRKLSFSALTALGLTFPDLLAAVDVIVAKPGYGTVSEAIAAGCRLVYTERGDFPEYPIMVAEMGRYLPCEHISNADLMAGRLGPAIGRVLSQPERARPRIDGARVVAERLLVHAGL